MSKTIKIIANKKNRVENGIRAVWFGSNPHSNGESFSRSFDERAEVIKTTVITSNGSIVAIMPVNISIFMY